MKSIIVPTRRPERIKDLADNIDKFTDNYELIVIDHEAGLNEKINYGLRLAKGDYLVLLHDDNQVTEGWLDILPEGVGAFKIGEMGDSLECWGGLGGGYCTDPTANPDYSAFLIMTRKAYAKIGPTDEFYKEPGYQDNDYGKQIAKAGFKIQCLPGKIIHHALRLSPLSEENREYFNKKWVL